MKTVVASDVGKRLKSPEWGSFAAHSFNPITRSPPKIASTTRRVTSRHKKGSPTFGEPLSKYAR